MHKCHTCGSEIRVDDIFCPKCGDRINYITNVEELNRNMETENNYTYSQKKSKMSIIRKVVCFISYILIVLVSIGVMFNIIFPIAKVDFDQDLVITLGMLFLIAAIIVYWSKVSGYILLLTISINALLAYKSIYLYNNILLLEAHVGDVYIAIIGICVIFTLLYSIFNIISLCIILGRHRGGQRVSLVSKFMIIIIIIAVAGVFIGYYVNNKAGLNGESFNGHWSGTFKLDNVKYKGYKDFGDGYYFDSKDFKPSEHSMEFTISKVENKYELKFKNTSVLSEISVKKLSFQNKNIIFTLEAKDDSNTSLIFKGELKDNNIISGIVSINNTAMGEDLATGTWSVSKISNTASEIKNEQNINNNVKNNTSNEVSEKSNTNESSSSNDKNNENSETYSSQKSAVNDTNINKLRLKIGEGKIDGLEFNLGDKKSSILSKWGNPKETEFISGGEYLYYDLTKVFYVINPANQSVVAISFGLKDNTSIFGAKIGMTQSEIESILGKPSFENPPSPGDECVAVSTKWTFGYTVGHYNLTFYLDDKNGPTKTARYSD